MRLLIVSDIQLGAGAGYGTPQTPRLADQARTLEVISTLVHEAAIDGVVFCGDAFQHRRPDVDELLVFAEWLESLPVDVLMLAGNHDVRGPGRRSVLELFDVSDYDSDVRVFTRPAVRVMDDVEGGHDVVAGFLPWTHPGTIRAHGNPDPDELADALLKVAEGLRGQAEELTRSSGYVGDGPEPMPVLFTHYALSGGTLPTGLPTSELREPVLDTNALLEQGWHYVFAGHVHAPGIVGESFTFENGMAYSIGSPHVCDFGEADVAHGVWILDTAADSAEHVPISGRPFVTHDLNLTRSEGIFDLASLPDVAGAVVRVRIQCTQEDARRLDVDALRRALYEAGAHKVWNVHLDVERRARARAEVLEDTEPLEALDAWLASLAEPLREGEGLRELTRTYIEEA